MSFSSTQDNFQSGVNHDSVLQQITNCMGRSLDLQNILETTVREVRSLLGTDRVKIYQFHADGSGQVVAEAVLADRLPSLLGLNFPADDIPLQARELFLKARLRSIVDVEAQQIGQSLLQEPEEARFEQVRFRPLDPCHAEYLTAMGVKSSLVVPLLHHDQLWGLLVSHHAEPLQIPESHLQTAQMVADQLSMAIAHATLLSQVQVRADREAMLNRVATLLRSEPTPKFQAALREIVAAFGGSGGRLCMRRNGFDPHSSRIRDWSDCLAEPDQFIQLYVEGKQPILSDTENYRLIEQYSSWQQYLQSSAGVWTVSDIYQLSDLGDLHLSFHAAKIRGVLVIQLQHRQQTLGYLTIFRDSVETETLWAGQFDPDQRQLYPRLSFEVWRESKKAQVRAWTIDEIGLAQTLRNQVALALQQYELHQQVQQLNIHLEEQVHERTAELQQAVEQQETLFRAVSQIRGSLDLNTIFHTTTEEVCRSLGVDRVSVYRFNADWGGEFVATFEFASSQWSEIRLGAEMIWNDTYLQETQGGRYRNGDHLVVEDIYQMGFRPCHVKILEQYQIRAFATVPIFVGQALWGLLAAYQHAGPRPWNRLEVQFLNQVATQLGVAVQQANLLVQTQQQADDLQQVTEQQRILFEVVTRIRASLDLDEIFETTTREVRRSLQVDRVGVFRFDPGSHFTGGAFVSEHVLPQFPSALATPVHDHCFSEQYAADYQRGRIQVVTDIETAGLQACHRALLTEFQVRAQVVVPLMQGDTLWGLLCVHQCAEARVWQASEIQFLTQVAAQLGVAIRQADLLGQTRQQAEQLAKTLHDLQQAQTQLIQTEKMSSLGQLVAGIAHEINNPVNFIYGNLVHVSDYAEDLLSLLELYQQHYPNPHPEIEEQAEAIDLEFLAADLPKTLSSMKVGSERIRQLVLSLRNFSRLDQAEMKPVDIHEGIESTLLILQYRFKANGDNCGISLLREYGELPPIECYAGQLNQVFMNILSNSIDALEESSQFSALSPAVAAPSCQLSCVVGGGAGLLEADSAGMQNFPTIRIRTEILEADRIAIRIADNGKGMSEEVRSRLFDPFFTTKPVGKGTGLGLSISHQIVVEKHRGRLHCISALGQGTEFIIEIPVQAPAS